MVESHTNGPWGVSEQSGDFEGAFKGIIAPVQTNSLGKEYRVYVAQYVEPKNAHLIAAAPDLLRVAELLVDWLDEDEGAHQLCDAARSAISKATP